MAKKVKKEKVARSAAANEQARRFKRYCFIALLGLVVTLTWVSFLTSSRFDPPSPLAPIPAQATHNSTGIVGAFCAYWSKYYFGCGIYIGLVFATVLVVRRGAIKDFWWRAAGAAILLVSISTAAYLVNPGGNVDVASGYAGVLGRCIGYTLRTMLHPAGAWIVLAVSLAVGLMLAADHFVLKLPALGLAIWRRVSEHAPAAIAALRPRMPVTVSTAASRAAGAAASRVSLKPAAKPAEEEPDLRPEAAAPAKAPPKLDAKSDPRGEPKPQARPAQEAEVDSPARPTMPSTATTSAPVPVGPAPKPQPAPKPAPAKESDADDKPAKPDQTKPGPLFAIPSASLLADPTGGFSHSQEEQAEQKRAVLQQTLNDFNVEAQVVDYMTGPVITLFELSLAPGVKVAQVANLATDIARALAVPGVRVFSPIPGKDTIGVEVPNMQKETVRIKELMNMQPEAKRKFALPLYLGKDAGGEAIVVDLSRMPHMLIAGTTGSGKSVCINSIIMSLLLTKTPEDVRFILVDPKMVEMAAFESIPQLLCPVVNDMKHAEDILDWAATKMDERYELLKEAGVKNIAGFNALSKDEIYERFRVEDEEEKVRIPTHLPYYVIIIDELADLIMTSSKEVEGHIIRIAQKARAVGIHLILATQRPSVNVVTGLIKSNMPCRISFRVASRQESRIVLDQNGAEVLLGQGDMLMLQPGASHLLRAQGTFVDDGEIRTVVDTLRQAGEPQYHAELLRLGSASVDGEGGGGEKDELFDKAVEIVLAQQRGSVSLLQRRLQIGYSRSSRIIDQMADAGILGDYKGSQARECNMTLEDWHTLKSNIADDQSGASSANGEPTSA
jgi:S-DNA-T family DNA segregation ATPase FtsK/SpoIIIE